MKTISVTPGSLKLCIAARQQTNDLLVSTELSKLEPSFLAGKDGAVERKPHNDGTEKKATTARSSDHCLNWKGFKGTNRQPRSSKCGLRRFCGLGNKIGVEESNTRIVIDEKESASDKKAVGIVKNPAPLEKLAGKTADQSGPKNKKAEVRSLEREVSETLQAIHNDQARSKDSWNRRQHDACCLIQATFRGCLRHKLLLQRLNDVKEKKQAELKSIQARKQREMAAFRDSFAGKPCRREEDWQMNSKTVADLITKVRKVRDRNAKLQEEVTRSKKENRALAASHSRISLSAAKEERRVNSVENIGLNLCQLAVQYKDLVTEARTLLEEFDEMTGFNTLDPQSPRVSEIVKMMHRAEKEDRLL